MYVRCFGVGFGLGWRRVFRVRSRAELEDAARGGYVRLTWQAIPPARRQRQAGGYHAIPDRGWTWPTSPALAYSLFEIRRYARP